MEKYSEFENLHFVMRPAPEVFIRDEHIGKDIILLYNFLTKELYTIGDVNKEICEFLDGANSVNMIIDKLQLKYTEISHQEIASDTIYFLKFLWEKKFIKNVIEVL